MLCDAEKRQISKACHLFYNFVFSCTTDLLCTFYNDLAGRPEIITAQNPRRDQNSYRRGQIHYMLERKLCISLKEKELLFKEVVQNCKKKIREIKTDTTIYLWYLNLSGPLLDIVVLKAGCEASSVFA